MPFDSTQFCQGVTGSLLNFSPQNSPEQKATPVGFLSWLLGPYNGAGLDFQATKMSRNGHPYNSYTVHYNLRSTVDDTSTTRDCDDGTAIIKHETTIDSDIYRKITIPYKWSQIRHYCEEYSQMVNMGGGMGPQMREVATSFISALNGLRVGINQDLLALAQLSIREATSPYAVGFENLEVISTSMGGAKLESALQTIIQNTQDWEMSGGRYGVIGQGVINRFMTSLKYPCCNQFGLAWNRVAEEGILAYYNDLSTNAIWGDDAFAVVEPGAFQFLYRLDNEGSFGGTIGTSKKFTMEDPMQPGLRYDVTMRVNECGADGDAEVIFTVGLAYGLFSIPDDAYQSTDRLYQTQGAIGYIAQVQA